MSLTDIKQDSQNRINVNNRRKNKSNIDDDE